MRPPLAARTRASLLLALVLAAAGGPAWAQEPAAATSPAFELERVADGVYAAVVRPRPPMYVFANALIVTGRDAVLVVDTHASPSAARELIGLVRGVSSQPVRWVVNTHWHGDHVYGNAEYRRAFPGVRILGHRSTAEDVAGAGAEQLRDELAELPPSIEQRRRWLETGLGPEGTRLTAADRDAVTRSLSLREGQLAELRGLRLEPPDSVFDGGIAIDLGGREVRLRHVGPAHTRGDVIVQVPAQRVVAVGDLVEEGLPYAGHAYPAGWAAALREIADLRPDVLLPSHGGVLRDLELLERQRGFFQAVAAAAREAADASACADDDPAAALARLDGSSLRRLLLADDVAAERFDGFLRETASRALAEACGEDPS